MPMSMAIEPTTACNLSCPECPSGLNKFTRKTGNIDLVFFKKTIDHLAEHVFYLTLYFQGEPYIHPGFFEMVEYSRRKRIYTSTSTNAHFLNDENARRTVESGLDRLIISMDGTTPETYRFYRAGGKIETVIEGTKNILRWKKELGSKTPYVIFQFIVFRHNEHQVDEIKKLGKQIGVDEVKIKTAQLYSFENGSDLLPQNGKYSRYGKTAGGKFAIKSNGIINCRRMWHSFVMTWDGLVIPCCFDKDAVHQMGNSQKDSVAGIWESSEYREFRKSVFKGRKEVDICANCSEGARVWI